MSNQKIVQSQISALKHKKFLFTFLIFLLIVVMVWVMISLFTSQNTLKISAELKNLAKPLTPNLNLGIFADLQDKQAYSSEDLKQFPIYYFFKSKDGRETKLLEINTQLEASQSAQPKASVLSPSPYPTASSQFQEDDFLYSDDYSMATDSSAVVNE